MWPQSFLLQKRKKNEKIKDKNKSQTTTSKSSKSFAKDKWEGRDRRKGPVKIVKLLN